MMNGKVAGLIEEGLEWALVAQAAAEGITKVVEALRQEAATIEDVEGARMDDTDARKALAASIAARKERELARLAEEQG